jgi:hypothetical protein
MVCAQQASSHSGREPQQSAVPEVWRYDGASCVEQPQRWLACIQALQASAEKDLQRRHERTSSGGKVKLLLLWTMVDATGEALTERRRRSTRKAVDMVIGRWCRCHRMKRELNGE